MIRNSLIALQGTVIAQAIMFLFMPVLARAYPPHAFGAYQYYFAVLNFLAVLCGLRYEVALLRARGGNEERAVLRLALGLNLGTALLVMAGCGALALMPWFASRLTPTTLLLLPVGLLFGGVFQTLSYVLFRYQALGINSIAKIGQSLAFGLLGIAAAWLGAHTFGLVVADVAGRALAAVVAIIWIMRTRKTLLGRISRRAIVTAARRHRSFPLYSVPGALLTASLSLIVPSAMLISFGVATMGQYALVERVLLAPAGLVGQSIAQAFTAQLSAAVVNKEDALLIFHRIVGVMALLGLLPSLVLLVAGPWLVVTLFGPQWELAGELSRAIVPMFYSSLVTAPVNMALLIIGAQKYQFGWEITRLVVIAVTWGAMMSLRIDPVTAIIIHASCQSVMNVLYLAIVHVMLRRLTSARTLTPI